MRAPASVQSTKDLLRRRLDTLGRGAPTLGSVLDVVRNLYEEIAEPGTSLRFETYGLTEASVTVEVVFRWPHPDELEAPPERLRLCLDVPTGPLAREVELTSRDYPHVAAFLTAALEASELDSDAPASNVRALPERA